MERGAAIELWNLLHREGGWITSWQRAVGGLTPEQASWKPSPERHSIWQLVNHMIFWREYAVSRQRGGESLGDEEIERRNWAEPDEPSAAAWAETVARFEKSHALVAEALGEPGVDHEWLKHLIPHDAYHSGQVMQLRGMLGLPPIE